jgi:small-conductance mechanosensitive channel/CRP-like cAMP-binding protein
LRRFVLPGLLTIACLIPLGGQSIWMGWLGASEVRFAPKLLAGFQTLAWVGATWLAALLADGVVRARFQRRRGREAPRLLRDLVVTTIVLAGLSSMSVAIFGVRPSTAAATSGVVVAVVGFAIRHLIADLFYGVTLALERPFEIGDWIQMPDGMTGEVTEFTWRAVKFVTYENLKVIVPNSTLATNQLVNYDQPDPSWRTALRITLGYEVDVRQAERLLLSAVEQVPESAELRHEAQARIVEYGLEGIVWELRFWVPNFPSASEVRQHVNEALLRNLHYAGVRVPREREEVLVGRLEDERAADRAATHNWIERIALFSPLAESERIDLQEGARRIEIPRGSAVVRRDEPGSSLFVLAEGVLEVWIDEPGRGTPVSTMRPGDFFGEMSLLTGEPRSATVLAATGSVVYEITRADLAPLLARHDALPQQLAQMLAARSQADTLRDELDAIAAKEVPDAGRTRQLLTRIREYFDLS